MDSVDKRMKMRKSLQRGDIEVVILKDRGKVFQREETVKFKVARWD